MTTRRDATIQDTTTDINSLEELLDNPTAFYRLIKTINSAITYHEHDGKAMLEE